MSAPSTPKPAETPVPPDPPEVVEPAVPAPEPPAPPEVETPYHNPFSPIVTSNSERILTCLPIRTIVPSPPSGQSTGGNSAASSGGRYSVLLLIAALSKVTAPENMSASKERYKYVIYGEHGEKLVDMGSNLDWTVALWDLYNSTATYWNLRIDDAAELIIESKSENSDPSICKGGIVCGHITEGYKETVELMHKKARTRAQALRRTFDSEKWAAQVVDDISGDLRETGQMQSPRGNIPWATDSTKLRNLLRTTATVFPQYFAEEERWCTVYMTGIGLLAGEKYVLVDQYFLAMKREGLPNKRAPCNLSFSPPSLDVLHERVLCGQDKFGRPVVPPNILSDSLSTTRVAVLLIPTRYSIVEAEDRDKFLSQNEILWSLVIADPDPTQRVLHAHFNLPGRSVSSRRVNSQQLKDAPGGIHVGYCRPKQDPADKNGPEDDVHAVFLQTAPQLDTLQWTFRALRAAAARLDGGLLVCPDGRTPLTLECIEAFATHLTEALEEEVPIVPEDGVGEIRMTTREAIGSGQGDLFDEHYLHLRRGVWKVLGFGEHEDKRISSGSAQADTSHMPTATVPRFLPAHMLGQNGHAILYRQPKTTFDMHPLTYTAGYELPPRRKR